MNIYRLKSWMHNEPKQSKEAKGIRNIGFKTPPREHGIFLHLGNILETQELSEELLIELLKDTGLTLTSGEIIKDSYKTEN